MTDPVHEADSTRQMGALLREARRLHGWTLAAAAAASGGRFKPSTIAAYERGDRRISATALHELSRLYQAPVTTLLPSTADATAQEDLLLARINLLPGPHRELLTRLIEQMFIDTRAAATPDRSSEEGDPS